MEQTQYNSLFSFIWNIATDVLVYAIDYLKEFKQRLISDAVAGQICVAEPQKGETR